MTFDPFEAAISALPVAKLSALEREIDAQIAELQSQRQKVHGVLAGKASGTPAPQAPRAAVRAGGKRRKRGIGKKRQSLMKKIIEAEPGKQWLPVDLEHRLNAEGDTASRDSIRNLVRQMVDDGEVARHPSGNGVTASGHTSSNGSSQESLSEVQT